MKFFEFKEIWGLSTNDFMNRWKKIDEHKKARVVLSIYIFIGFSFFAGNIEINFWVLLPFFLGILHILMYTLKKIMY